MNIDYDGDELDPMKGILAAWGYTMTIVVIVLLCLILFGCKTQYVPIETVHTVEHHHTDSIRQTDSIWHEKETTIMQLDSATMAQYGIQLKAAEKAWLVRSRELERRLKELSEIKGDTIIRVDSIQVPMPVERKLTKWEQVKMDYGAVAIGVSIAAVVAAIIAIILWIRRKGL